MPASFGAFNLRIQNFDGDIWALTSISFTLENLSGTWASAYSVLTANAAGFIAADHIYVYNSIPPVQRFTQGEVIDGFAGAKVPEPTTLLLLGLGLLGVAGMGRRLRK